MEKLKTKEYANLQSLEINITSDVIIDKLLQYLTDIKAEGSTHIHIYCYDNEVLNILPYFMREESDEECKERIEAETKLKEDDEAKWLRQERIVYEQLKRKFEPSIPNIDK